MTSEPSTSANSRCLGDECKHRVRATEVEAVIRAGENLAWDLIRFDLSKRQYLLLASIWLESLAKGAPTLIIPTWDILGDLSGMRPNHISSTKEELVEMRVLEYRKVEGIGIEVRIQMDVNLWHCRPRQTRAKVKETREWLRNHNSPHRIIEEGWTRAKTETTWSEDTQRNFKNLPGSHFLSAQLPDSGTSPVVGEWVTSVET